MSIRNSSKAIIVQDNKILLTVNDSENGEFCLMPGGGADKFESLTDALRRECLEETGYTVSVGTLRYVREYIGRRSEFAKKDYEVHQIEFYFLCEIIGEAVKPTNYDGYQTGVRWVDIKDFPTINLYPKILKSLITLDGFLGEVYLGVVN